METNWNQLIERYLQNELSEEGKLAFEQELKLNPELREELEMHQLIQSAAKRASQRTMVQQAGKVYFRNVRIKQIALGVLLTAAAATGIVYWSQQKQPGTDKPKQELLTEQIPETEPILPEDTLNTAGNPSSDNISPLQIPDGTVVGTEARSKVSFTKPNRLTGSGAWISKDVLPRLKTIPVTFRQDTIALEIIVPVSSSGSKENQPKGVISEENVAKREWQKAYDSVGRFNDLYCGYALVMHQEKIGFVDPNGKFFIPLMYDEIVVTSNIHSSKDRFKKKRKKKVLYIPKRSGSEVQYCDEKVDARSAADSVR